VAGNAVLLKYREAEFRAVALGHGIPARSCDRRPGLRSRRCRTGASGNTQGEKDGQRRKL
jgi:hypothetical protein